MSQECPVTTRQPHLGGPFIAPEGQGHRGRPCGLPGTGASVMATRTITYDDPLVLQHLQVAAREMLSPSVVERMELSQWAAPMLDRLVYQLRSYVQAQHLAESAYERTVTVPFDHPATWWQHLKMARRDTWGWRRFVRRFPVRIRVEERRATATVTVDRYHAYPDSTVLVPHLGRPVRWEVAR